VLGFYNGDEPLLGFISSSRPNTWLHVVIAVVSLFLGFGTAKQTA
jgi:hypothetical protein